MKNRRKLSIRTETFEQIVIRSKSKKLNFCANRRETDIGSQAGGNCPMEIYRIETEGEEKVSEVELPGSIETVESDFHDRFDLKKQK